MAKTKTRVWYELRPTGKAGLRWALYYMSRTGIRQTEFRIGSVDTTGDIVYVNELLAKANKYMETTQEEMNFTINVTLTADHLKALTQRDNVRVGIAELRLKQALDKTGMFRVNFIEHIDNTPDPESKMKYIDEFPHLVGDSWELKMDAKGHNVTSHLNEEGPCSACVALHAQE